MLLNLRHMILVACALLVMVLGLQSALNPEHNLKTASAAASQTVGDAETGLDESVSGLQQETAASEEAAVAPYAIMVSAFAAPIALTSRSTPSPAASRITGTLERPPRA